MQEGLFKRPTIPPSGPRNRGMRSVGVKSGGVLTVMAACFGERPERAWLAHLEVHDAAVSLTFVENRVALIRCARTLRPRIVLLPLRDARGLPSAPLIARLREHAPNLRVMVLLAPETSRAGLAEAIRAGGEAAVLDGEAALRTVLFRTCDPGPLSPQELDAVRALLSDLRQADLQEALQFTVMHAHRRLSVADVAIARGVSTRALGRQARAASWPTPTELIGWGRLLRASILQWREGSNLPTLARASGFSSACALRDAAERLLQQSVDCPSELSPLLVSSRLQRRVHRIARGMTA